MIAVAAGQLREALQIAGGVAPKRTNVPVLKTVRCTVNGALNIEATDLDMHIGITVPLVAGGEQPARSFVLDGHRLISGALKGISEDVEIEGARADDRAVNVIRAGDLRLRLHENFVGDDFPAAPRMAEKLGELLLSPEQMAMLASVASAMSSEETRDCICGVNFLVANINSIQIAAIDGYRLLVGNLCVPEGLPEAAVGARFIMPRYVVEQLLKHCSKSGARLTFGRSTPRNSASLTEGAPKADAPLLIEIVRSAANGLVIELVSKTIDGTYPDYGRVIPKETSATTLVDRAALLAAIRRMSLTIRGGPRIPALSIAVERDRLRISRAFSELGSWEVAVACEHRGAPLSFGVNGGYLRDMLAALTSAAVQFSFDKRPHCDPMILRDPESSDLLGVLMPMRV